MTLMGKKIIVIDDTSSIRTFLRVSLEDEGVELHEAATASEGIRLCKELNPDIVILDLGLPDMDGMEALEHIKVHMRQEDPPSVVVLTVRKGRDIMEEAYRKGANAYINKPFMVDDLLEVMEHQIK